MVTLRRIGLARFDEALRSETEQTLGRIPQMLRCGANDRAAGEVLAAAGRRGD